jgi:enterochelin esterase-like enzyme
LFAFGLLVILAACLPAAAQNDYKIGPDSQVQPGVPQGEVTHYTWKSKIYPGTERNYWVYVPKQYDPAQPACVMVCQDGGGYQDRNGGFRLPNVFDNLINRHEMPVTIGIMIDPGVVPARSDGKLPRYNRSYEYDAPTDVYARFLQEEILPEVGKKYNLTTDPNGRAICGASSGGICAFNAAWQRPDLFRRVISYVGSFTDLRGGNCFPPLIRKTEPKPLRIFLQDGAHDQDIYSGSWPIGNQDVAAALKFAGYDYQMVIGTGGHDGVQGSAIFPDAVRWIWRDYPTPLPVATSTPQPVMNLITPGETWSVVPGVQDVSALAADGSGTVYYASGKSIYRLSAAGQSTALHEADGPISSLAFGPGEELRYAVPSRKEIGAWFEDGAHSALHGIAASSIIMLANGELYAAEPGTNRVWRIGKNGKRTAVETALAGANCVQPTPDQSLLLVSQKSFGKYVYSYEINLDGSLDDRQEYFDLEFPYGASESGARAMAVDTKGWLYVTTDAGIQVEDQAGRVNGVLVNPEGKSGNAMTFGGPDRDMLYVAAGGKLYARKMRAKGVAAFASPLKPPGPRL